MAEVLKMLHLSEQDSVAQVEIGRRRVKSRFDAQGPSERQPFAQIFFSNEFG